MKKLVALLIALCCTVAASAATIREVIEAGINQQLSRTQSVSVTTVPRILAAFNRVKKQVNDPTIMLKVIAEPGTMAITANHTMIIHRSVETFSDVEIEFIVAHESGHIIMSHKEQRIRTYEKFIDGELTEQKANAVNAAIGAEMKLVSHSAEYEADRFAFDTLIKLGRSKEDIIAALLAMSNNGDTPTHPATAKRAAALRQHAASQGM